MRYIISRDPAYYWDQAYELSRILNQDGLVSWAYTVLRSLGLDHTHLPAAAQSLVFYLLSTDTLPVYGTTIIALYLAPIPVAAASVSLDRRDDRSGYEILTAGLVFLALMYPFVVRLMPTMPDFGGNLFITMAMALGARMIVGFDEDAPLTFRRLAPLVVLVLSLYFVAVLFRRWYGFAALGLLGSYTFALLALAYSSRGGRQAWTLLRILVGAGVVFAALSAPVLFAKVRSFTGGGVFTGAYDAYRTDYVRYFRSFGFGDLAAFGAIIAMALIVHRRVARTFLLFTLLASVLTVLLFFYVQAPGLHHFSLLWPILLVSAAAILSRIASLEHRPLGLVCAALASVIFIAAHFPTKPRVDRNYSAHQTIAKAISAFEIPDGAICPVGSRHVHNSLIDNLWQISGSRGGLPRSTSIPEADFGLEDVYASGSVHDVISKCQWIVTTLTMPLLYKPRFHRIVRYHHERLLDPESIIGRAYELKETLATSLPTPVLFYRLKDGHGIDRDALLADFAAWLADDRLRNP